MFSFSILNLELNSLVKEAYIVTVEIVNFANLVEGACRLADLCRNTGWLKGILMVCAYM